MKDTHRCREETAKLLYESISESVAQQRNDLRSLRGQAAIILAFNGIAASFLARVLPLTSRADSAVESVERAGPNIIFMGLAGFFFVLSLVFAMRVALPVKGWIFDLQVEKAYKGLCEGDRFGDLCHTYERLMGNRQRHYEKNEELLASTQSNLFISLVLAFAHVLCWILALMGTFV